MLDSKNIAQLTRENFDFDLTYKKVLVHGNIKPIL